MSPSFYECKYADEGMLNLLALNHSLNHLAMLKLPLVYSRKAIIQEMGNHFRRERTGHHENVYAILFIRILLSGRSDNVDFR